MDCARAPSAAAVAEPVRAPAQRADSVVKWAASHSSMQPESCRFNRGLATTLASAFGLAPVSRNHHRMRRNGEFALEEHAPQPATRCRITDALVPPKPNEFDNTTLISRLRGVCGTRSIAVSTDGFSRLIVGGATLSRIARIPKIASIAP